MCDVYIYIVSVLPYASHMQIHIHTLADSPVIVIDNEYVYTKRKAVVASWSSL